MILRRVVLPLVCAYGVFLAAALMSLRRPAPRLRRGDGAFRPELVRHLAATVVGGYALFLMIVLVFHVLIAGQRGALVSAVWGGGFLALVGTATLVLASALSRAWRARRRGMMDR